MFFRNRLDLVACRPLQPRVITADLLNVDLLDAVPRRLWEGQPRVKTFGPATPTTVGTEGLSAGHVSPDGGSRRRKM